MSSPKFSRRTTEELLSPRQLNTQYLQKDFLTNLNDFSFRIDPSDLLKTDTYHEGKILKKLLEYNKDDRELLLHSAVQMAIVGSGNKNYGFIKKNGVVINLIDLFKKLGIKYQNNLQTKLADDDITPRRLIRFFRYQIKNFLLENRTLGITSYLWKKYGRNVTTNEDMRLICFPGAEHFVETPEEIKFILNTYNKLDEIQNTGFSARITNVFVSRGLIVV